MTKEELKTKLDELHAALEAAKSVTDAEKVKTADRIAALENSNAGLREILKAWLMIRGSMTSVELFQATSGAAKVTTQILNSQG